VKIPSQIATLLAGIVITLVSLWYGQNHNLFPAAASDEAPLIDNLFNFMMTIGTGIFILVQGVLVWVAIRFNRKPKAEVVDGSPDHGNIPLEIVWTAIPAVIMLILSIYSFDVYQQIGGLNPMGHEAHMTQTAAKASMPGAAMAATIDRPVGNMPMGNMPMDGSQSDSPALNAGVQDSASVAQVDLAPVKNPDNAFNVNVSAMQFAWLFEYPGEDVTTGELHVPIGRDVVVSMKANDVIHAFWVPEFRIKQDAVPGITTTVRFTPNRLGEYPLICAELCGAYHGIMRSKVIVESETDYRTWIEGQKLAQAGELSSRVATAQTTGQMSDSEYLAPYAKDLAVTPEALKVMADHSPHPADMAASAG
jgi:cytochrome c oxidase subunit II